MNLATRYNAHLSRREEFWGAHFYLFRPVTHVAHSNLHAPTRLPEPAASRIVESFKIFMRHDPPLVPSRDIVTLEEGTRSSVTNRQILKNFELADLSQTDGWYIIEKYT